MINQHHPDKKNHPDWTLALTGQMHRLLTVIQRTKASEEQYARITNLLHCLGEEWTRMRRELDNG